MGVWGLAARKILRIGLLEIVRAISAKNKYLSECCGTCATIFFENLVP